MNQLWADRLLLLRQQLLLLLGVALALKVEAPALQEVVLVWLAEALKVEVRVVLKE